MGKKDIYKFPHWMIKRNKATTPSRSGVPRADFAFTETIETWLFAENKPFPAASRLSWPSFHSCSAPAWNICKYNYYETGEAYEEQHEEP